MKTPDHNFLEADPPFNAMNAASNEARIGNARDADRSIGALLVDSKRITLAQAEQIILQQKKLGIRFGEAALRLKLVTIDDIRHALARQHGYGYLRKEGSKVSPSVRAAFEPDAPAVEALRGLRSQLMLRWFVGQPDRRTLAVVSPEPGEGRSYVSSNLAVLFSQLGERTLLIDANLRKPTQHTLFGLENQTGLSSWLSERSRSPGIQSVPALANLSVLVAGPVPPNPQELLARDQFERLMAAACREFDIILLDTPSAHACADAHTVAKRAGAVVMVARERVSRVARLEQLSNTLSGLGTAVVGTVLNHY